MPNETTADAVDREVAWLTTSGDGLPALVATEGGPWDVVQAYWPRTLGTQRHGVYVLRRQLHDERSANIRQMPRYEFRLKLVWPLTTSSGSAEQEQRAFDQAVDLLLKRIAGTLLDKTHGGRFLSVAENPRYVDVDFQDPEETIAREKSLRCEVVYYADDIEINN